MDHTSDIEVPSPDPKGIICDDDHLEMIEISDWSQNGNHSSIPDEETERPSNEKLLSTAFLSFMSFTLCQTVAAVIAGSEAMMGDSAAMFVDALTYLFNLVAERKKTHFDATWIGTTEKDPQKARRIRQRAKRKMVLTMELIPPLISVTTLIVVTVFVLRHAIRVLVLDVHRPVSLQGDPNINLMLFFSSVNLFLDFLNVFCFARAKHLLGFKTVEENPANASTDHSYESVDTADELLEATNMQLTANASKVIQPVGNGMDGSPDPPGRKGLDIRHMHVDDSSNDNEHEGANLNMCSAYTHVFADTLRSIAVIVASVLAELVDSITPEEADATAAVVVSGLILLSLIPLFHGLCRTFAELRAIRAEEKSEQLFSQLEENRTRELD